MGAKNGKPLRPSKERAGFKTHRFKATSVPGSLSSQPSSRPITPPAENSKSILNGSIFSRSSKSSKSSRSPSPVVPGKVAPPPPLRQSNVTAQQVAPPPPLRYNPNEPVRPDPIDQPPQPQFRPFSSTGGPVTANSVPGYYLNLRINFYVIR